MILRCWIFCALTMIAGLPTNEEFCKLGKIGTRIIGGTDVSIEELPYQLSLRYNGDHDCGASLISSSWAASAAHCTFDREIYTVSLLAGTSNRLCGGQIRSIVQIFEHPDFDPPTAKNDIALLRASRPFVFGPTVRPIPLPSAEENWPDDTCGVVSGWGVNEEKSTDAPVQLQRVILPLVNQELCNFTYRGKISEFMFCAGYWKGGFDACQMDSGGPLAVDGKLIGIVSWGNRCALPGLPGVYTRVAFFRNWIASVARV